MVEAFYMSQKDISQRLHTKDDYYYFFVHINQRLLPNINHMDEDTFLRYFSGETRALRLLDSIEYNFSEAALNDVKLSVDALY